MTNYLGKHDSQIVEPFNNIDPNWLTNAQLSAIIYNNCSKFIQGAISPQKRHLHMNNPLSEIMTIEDVADYLRIPISSVYKLAQEGKIPAQKVGRHWRFYRPILTQWIAGQASFEGKKLPSDKLDFS